MGRYSEKYWDNSISPLEEAVGAIFTAGLTTLMDDGGVGYGCEITDDETGLVGTTHQYWSSKTKAHDKAWEDLVEKKHDLYESQKKEKEKAGLERYIAQQRIPGDDTGFLTLMVKWLLYIGMAVAAIWLVLWLAFAVALPLLVINIAAISLIVGFTLERRKTYLFLLALAGAIFIVADYNNGWLTKTLVENVHFFANVIPFFLYLNIAAGLIASYFLVRNIINKRKPPLQTDGEFSKRNLIMMCSLLAIGGATVYLQQRFYSQIAYDGPQEYSNNQSYSTPVQPSTSVNNPVPAPSQPVPENGLFTGRFFDVKIPQGFIVKPSLTADQNNGYSHYISAFFQSPDNQVEFYMFSGYITDVASDVALDPAKEKQTSILVKNTGANEITTWTEIKALDNTYLRAYQETKNPVTNQHKVVGLRYNSLQVYNSYKRQYLIFKKSYSELGGD